MRDRAGTWFTETVVAHLLPGGLFLALFVSTVQHRPLHEAILSLATAGADKPWSLVAMMGIALALGVAVDALRYLAERHLVADVLGSGGYVRGDIIAAERRAGASLGASFAATQLLQSYHYAEFCGNFGAGLALAGLFGDGLPLVSRIGTVILAALLLWAWVSAMRSIAEASRKLK